MKNSKSHDLIVNLLKKNGITDLHGGIQLFANQFDKEYSISVNYNGTKIHVPKKDIDEHELAEDELIQVCKIWEYKEKN